MAPRPYFLVGYKSLTASTAGNLTIEIGATEKFHAHKIRVKATSEGFDLRGITDQGGTPFTNVDTTTVLDGMLLTNNAENEYNEIELPIPWELAPQTKLTFDLKDTSGATNEVWILLIGTMETV